MSRNYLKYPYCTRWDSLIFLRKSCNQKIFVPRKNLEKTGCEGVDLARALERRLEKKKKKRGQQITITQSPHTHTTLSSTSPPYPTKKKTSKKPQRLSLFAPPPQKKPPLWFYKRNHTLSLSFLPYFFSSNFHRVAACFAEAALTQRGQRGCGSFMYVFEEMRSVRTRMPSTRRREG